MIDLNHRILSRQAPSGFSIIELMVVTLILSGVLIIAGNFFQQNTELARVQMNMADMQQSARISQGEIVKMTRMAGRGGVPLSLAGDGAGYAGKPVPFGVAIEVTNNVPLNSHIIAADNLSPRVLAETDILTIRGVFSNPIFQVSPVAANTLILNDPNAPTTGTIKVFDPNPVLQVPQDLSSLKEVLDSAQPEALILVSPLQDVYAVVEVTGGSVIATDPGDGRPTEMDINFRIGGSDIANGYLSLSPGGGFPTILRAVAALGILEEYRYFIREEHAVAADDASDLRPRLTRARFYPGADNVWGGDTANLRIDIADNVLDLQLAFAIDTLGDQILQQDVPSPQGDDWLYDDPEDDDTEVRWNGADPLNPPPLYYLRVSTLSRTERRHRGYVSPAILNIEDRSYAEATGAVGPLAEQLERRYHRYLLTTTIDLRNL